MKNVSLPGSLFDWQLGPKKNKKQTKKISQTSCLLYQGNFFPLEYFLLDVFEEFVPFHWFSQTRYLGMSIHLINFLRQAVNIKGQFVPLELFAQKSCFFYLSFYLYLYTGRWRWTNLIGRSSYGWSFLFGSIHIWYIVLSKAGYILWSKSLLHCYGQVATVFTFSSDNSVKLLILTRLTSMATKKLIVNIVVRKLESLTLFVTRRVVLLGHCFVPSVPIAPQNLKMIWIIILLRSTAPQSLMSPSFQASTIYVNIKKPTWFSHWDNKCWSWPCRQRSWWCDS